MRASVSARCVGTRHVLLGQRPSQGLEHVGLEWRHFRDPALRTPIRPQQIDGWETGKRRDMEAGNIFTTSGGFVDYRRESQK